MLTIRQRASNGNRAHVSRPSPPLGAGRALSRPPPLRGARSRCPLQSQPMGGRVLLPAVPLQPPLWCLCPSLPVGPWRPRHPLPPTPFEPLCAALLPAEMGAQALGSPPSVPMPPRLCVHLLTDGPSNTQGFQGRLNGGRAGLSATFLRSPRTLLPGHALNAHFGSVGAVVWMRVVSAETSLFIRPQVGLQCRPGPGGAEAARISGRSPPARGLGRARVQRCGRSSPRQRGRGFHRNAYEPADDKGATRSPGHGPPNFVSPKEPSSEKHGCPWAGGRGPIAGRSAPRPGPGGPAPHDSQAAASQRIRQTRHCLPRSWPGGAQAPGRHPRSPRAHWTFIFSPEDNTRDSAGNSLTYSRR